MINIEKFKTNELDGNFYGLTENIYEADVVNKFLDSVLIHINNYENQLRANDKLIAKLREQAADKVDIMDGMNCYNVGTYIPYDVGRDYDGYENIQKIWADSEKEAVEKYNIKNKCYYYYGKSLGRIK
jgi:hypothetical protein